MSLLLFSLADVHITVDPTISVSAAHQVAERCRLKVLQAFPSISDLLVHVEPASEKELEEFKQAQLTANKLEKQGKLDPLHSESPSIEPTHHLDKEEEEHDDDHSPFKDHPSAPHPDFHQPRATTLDELMRPQVEIEADVMKVLQKPHFVEHIQGLTHFTCHYVDGQLTVQMEVVMSQNIKIREAKQIALELNDEIRAHVEDVKRVDVHLELTREHIEQVGKGHGARRTIPRMNSTGLTDTASSADHHTQSKQPNSIVDNHAHHDHS